LNAIFDEFRSSLDFKIWLEMADQAPISHEVRIGSAELRIKQLLLANMGKGQYELESTIQMSRHDEISNRQSFSNEIGVIK